MKRKRETDRNFKQNSYYSPPPNLNSQRLSNKPLPCLQGSSSYSFNPNTPVRRTVTEKSSSSAVRSDDSGYDSGGDLAVATNKDIIVRVLETFTRNNGHSTLALLISSTRGDTNLGKKQGAHVTAYRALLEVLIAYAEGYDIREAKKLIIAISKKLLPNKSKIFDDILEQINKEENKILSSAERREFIQTLMQNPNYSKDYIEKLDLNLALGRRKQHIDAIELIATSFLREVNLDENIAFTRSGLSDSKEGTRVRLAVHALKLLVELIEFSLNPDLLTQDRLKHFHNSYTVVNAPYKDGIKRLGLKPDCFTFMNVDWVRNKLDFQELLQQIKTDTIASLCGDLFDFKYRNHKFADIEVLFKVLAKHLVIIFTAFDSLRKSHELDKIIDCFLIEEILKKEGWYGSSYFLAERLGVDDQSNKRRVLRSGNFFAEKVSYSKQVEILKQGISKYMDFANFELISINDMMPELSF